MGKIEKINSRDSNFELLRCILMFMIVFLHMFVHGVNGEIVSFRGGETLPTTLLESFFLIFCMVSVNCYVMISGWFGINLTKKKLLNTYFPVFFYSVLIALLFFAIQKIELKEFLFSFFPFMRVTYWFATCYIVLLLLSPFLNTICEKFYDKPFLYFLIFIICFFSWIPKFVLNFKTVLGLQSLGLSQVIVCYILGRSIHLLKINKNIQILEQKKLMDFVFYCIASLLSFFMTLFFFLITKKNYWFSLSAYSSPLTMLASVFFTLFFSKINIGKNKVINIVGRTTFGIYLIHENPLMRPIIYKFFHAYDYKHTVFLIPYVLVISFIVFSLGSGLEIIRSFVFSIFKTGGKK